MKVVLHEGTAPANGALKTRARLKRVTVPHRRSYVGCSGPLGNPTELKKILLRGNETPAQAGAAQHGHCCDLDRATRSPVQTVYCSVCQQFQNNPCKTNTPVQLHRKPHSWKAAFPNIPPPRHPGIHPMPLASRKALFPWKPFLWRAPRGPALLLARR